MATIAAEASPDKRPRLTLRGLVIDYGLLVLLVALILLFSLMQPAFFRVTNLFSILQAVAIVLLLGVGVTVTMIAGGFDLSVGGLAAFIQMAAAYVLIVLNGSTASAIGVSLLLGVIVGAANAFLIVRMRVPDLLATLGMLFLLAGLQLIPTGGHSIAPGMTLDDDSVAPGEFTEAFFWLGRYRFWGIVPVPVVILIIVTLLLWVVMERTRYGRVFYAVGGNELAARLAGAPTSLYRALAYILSSVIASVGGVLLAARIGRGDVSAGNGLMLDAVAAALIGYAVLGANRPNIFGTIVGAIFVVILDQDFVLQLELVLDEVKKDNGTDFNAGYVYVEGFPALDQRHKAWQRFKKQYPGVKQLAQWGAVDDTTSASVANQTQAAFLANPDISVVVAPYDEFARGVKIAADENSFADKIKIYSVDVSTSDIQAMREPGSPWVATSAASADGIGETALRTLAPDIAGQLKERNVCVEATLITQKFLKDHDIKSEKDLVAKFPAFLGREVSSAPWIPEPK